MAWPQGVQRPGGAAHPCGSRPMPVPAAAGGALPAGGGTEERRGGPDETDLFRIHCYKVLPCGKRYAHDWMRCPFRHPGENAARRPLNESSWYSATMCPDLHGGSTCPRGDACGFAHNVFEHWLHPDRYRTQLCRDGAACSRRVCFFAHSIQQLRTPTRRVIAEADTAEAEAAPAAAAAAETVAAAGWAVAPGLGGNQADASGLMADSAYPRPLANMIVYIPPPPGTDAAAALTPYGAAAGALVSYEATSIVPSAGHSGLHQSAAGLLNCATLTTAAPVRLASDDGWPGASAGLAEPSMADVFQALMLDASNKQAVADAATVAATRAHTAASEAAALVGRLTRIGPNPTASCDAGIHGSTATAARMIPCLVNACPFESQGLAAFEGPGRPQPALLHTTRPREQPLNRRPASASCSALLIGGSPLPGTAAAFAPPPPAGLPGASSGAPLLRFLSGGKPLSGAGIAPALAAAPLAAAPTGAGGASVQLQRGAAPTVWYNSL